MKKNIFLLFVIFLACKTKKSVDTVMSIYKNMSEVPEFLHSYFQWSHGVGALGHFSYGEFSSEWLLFPSDSIHILLADIPPQKWIVGMQKNAPKVRMREYELSDKRSGWLLSVSVMDMRADSLLMKMQVGNPNPQYLDPYPPPPPPPQ